MGVRVRYAPSPTGLQHIGGVRTALFNYFFARSQNGTFILRIEDTDQERYHAEALEDIYSTFHWLGISWDEGPDGKGEYGPYFQSQRIELYRKYAQQLLDIGSAYLCYCSEERLEKLREGAGKDKKSHGYDRHCRNLTEQQRLEYQEKGITPVVRLKIPLQGETSFEDVLLGKITRKNEDIAPDPILLKSDGYPTYHLANVVDDHLMNITHIMRAQEWLSSGPIHGIMYNAFGWKPPIYCHLPMVVGKDGQKLSKRHGATSVREFRNQGYLPEALINYISLLGWSYDDSREMFTKEELERVFTLEKLNKAPAVFDYKKLEWFNGVYIRKKTEKELMEQLSPFLQAAGVVSSPLTTEEQKILEGAIPIIHERLKYLAQAPEMLRFLFQEVTIKDSDALVPKKSDTKETLQILQNLRDIMESFENRSDEENERMFRDSAKNMGIKLGKILMPLRIAVTGSAISPPLFESIRLVGVDNAIKRIDNAIALIQSDITDRE